MKISLTVADRVGLQQILPEKDSFENLCIRSEILDKTSFSSDEIEANKIKTIKNGETGMLTWIETESKEYEFNSISISYIQSNLKRLSDAKELTAMCVPLYKKIHAE